LRNVPATSLLALAVALQFTASSPVAAQDAPDNPQIDYPGFVELAGKVGEYREQRRLGWDAFAERALADTGRPQTVVPGRPKATIIDWYFRRIAVDGMTDPFFLEILVSSDLLPFERPFVTAHEWSHLAGVADEGEANFVGWLACMRGSPAAQYSGWLFMYNELVGVSSRADRAALASALAAGPREDLQAIRDRPALRSLPVVIVTTSANPRDVRWCFERGANAYHVKPMPYAEHRRGLEQLFFYWLRLVQLPAAEPV